MNVCHGGPLLQALGHNKIISVKQKELARRFTTDTNCKGVKLKL